MQSLKNLHFVSTPKNTFNPLLYKRNKLIARLQDQKALLENPIHCAIDHRWETQSDGRRELVERKRKVRPWWRQEISGKFLFSVQYGQKPIEFEKGKAAIQVAAKDQLFEVIDVLIAAIQAGEFDEAITAMGQARTLKKKAQQGAAAQPRA